jgi:GNAT superfamily N-acetyltransferase
VEVEISEEKIDWLDEHARISIAFKVESVWALSSESHGLGGLRLSEKRLDRPYVKVYDVLPNRHPTQWAAQFDMANWGFFSARIQGTAVGGAVLAWHSPDFDMLEGRTDMGVVWDIRVVPEMRRRGIAAQLFTAVERWARDRGCRQLKVETQNINVAACRFYASRGFELGTIDRFAYRDLPEEIQLVWYKTLC